jgi:hypothetical protein
MKSLIGLLASIFSSLALAQSALEVDPQHYQLVFENDCVRVVHIKYGPGERNAGPYQSRGGAAVALSDLKLQREREGEPSATITKKAGESWWVSPGKLISLVNLSDKAGEWIAVVPKGKAGCEK